jgi:LytS/YehU family sensor histidine kinase
MQHYERRKQEQLKLESLRGQMNPHFTFNSLNAVNYFISINDQKKANEYISDLSRLIRSLLNYSQQEFIPLDLEVNNIKDYLKLEHLRFSDKFDYQVIVSDDLFQEPIMVSPFLVQPFAENAILHGLCTLNERKGFLKLEFRKNNAKSIICIIEDDGIGRTNSESMKSTLDKTHQSRGSNLIYERIEIMNNLYHTKNKLLINDLYPGQENPGTRVILEIPFIYQT